MKLSSQSEHNPDFEDLNIAQDAKRRSEERLYFLMVSEAGFEPAHPVYGH